MDHMKPDNKSWKELEKRFGEAEIDVVTRFGEAYLNGIEGWQFTEEEVKRANAGGRLLTMDLDFPGLRCKLNCSYCFARDGETSETYFQSDKDKPITLDEIKPFLLEAKELGLRSIKVIGYREPFDNPGIHDFIDFATENDLHLVIFTAAYTLGEERFLMLHFGVLPGVSGRFRANALFLCPISWVKIMNRVLS